LLEQTVMAEMESRPVAEPIASRGYPRRIWIPLVALAIAAVAMLAVPPLLAERYDVGVGRMASVIFALLACLTVIAWFFFGAGMPRRARAVGAILLGSLAVLGVGSVRRVEFSGDMVPTFDFRWRPDRLAVLEEHRKHSEDVAVAKVSLNDVQIGQYDVLEYRGPRRDGIEPGPPLARDWTATPPKLLWRQPCGGGYASFLVVGPALVTIEQRGPNEAIVAYEADTGREIWVSEYPALFSETAGGDGPRATPTYHDGRIYALGATGRLTAIDFSSGKELWHANILQQNESGNLDWAMSGSPLVYDGLVVVNPGDQKGTPESRAIAAYSADDGKRKWAAGKSKASYSSLMLVTLGGVRQLLLFDGAGLAGCDPADGHELWRLPWKTDWDINAAQPVVLDEEHVAITSAGGSALLKVAKDGETWKVDEVWKNRKLKGGYASPIAHQGYLYALDVNILTCTDLANGKLKWKDRKAQFGHGQILLRDDLLLVLGEAGELALVAATPERYEELGRIQAIEGKTWNVPTLVGNRIYVRNHLEMAAYELPTATSP
jgi:outer membrane protein assembly factor BamB